MANAEKQIVRLMADEIVKILRQSQVENTAKMTQDMYSSIAKYLGNVSANAANGDANAATIINGISQLTTNTNYSQIANYIGNAVANAAQGDANAGLIVNGISGVVPSTASIGDALANFASSISGDQSAADTTASLIVAGINGLSTIQVDTVMSRLVETDELYASYGNFINLVANNAEIGTLDVEEVHADLATIVAADIGVAKIDIAQLYNMSAENAFITRGVGNSYYLDDLIVRYAQMVSATIGDLTLKADNGNYYSIDVDDNGNVTATQVTVTEDEIAAGHTDAGSVILETSITAESMNTSDLTATFALLKKIDAERIDVDYLFAREAFIGLLATEIIKSVNGNSRINMLDDAIKLVVDSDETGFGFAGVDTAITGYAKVGSTQSASGGGTSLALTDEAITAVGNKIQLIADEIQAIAKQYIFPSQTISMTQTEYETWILTNTPADGDLWIDTTDEHDIVYKQWDGDAWRVVSPHETAVGYMSSEFNINTDSIQSIVSDISTLTGRVDTAESKITPTAIVNTVTSSSSFTNVAQTADKINWLVSGGTSASDIVMTDGSISAITNKLNLNIGGINISAIAGTGDDSSLAATISNMSGNITTAQQTADKIGWIVADGSSMSSLTLTQNALDAIARDITISADNVILDAANNISVTAGIKIGARNLLPSSALNINGATTRNVGELSGHGIVIVPPASFPKLEPNTAYTLSWTGKLTTLHSDGTYIRQHRIGFRIDSVTEGVVADALNDESYDSMALNDVVSHSVTFVTGDTVPSDLRLRYFTRHWRNEGSTTDYPDSFTFTYLQLERGMYKTDYTPCQDDVDGVIDDAQNTANTAQAEISDTDDKLSELRQAFEDERAKIGSWLTFDSDGLTIGKNGYIDDEGNFQEGNIWTTVTDNIGFHVKCRDISEYVFSAYRDRCRITNLEIGDMVIKSSSRGGTVWVNN